MVRSSISHHSQVTLINFLLQSHILTLLLSNLQFDLLHFHSCNIVYFIYRTFALMSDSITIIKQKKSKNVDWKTLFQRFSEHSLSSRRWIWVITTNDIATYMVRIRLNAPMIVYGDERYRHIYGLNIIKCTNHSFRLLKLDIATSAQRVNAHALLAFITLSRNNV